MKIAIYKRCDDIGDWEHFDEVTEYMEETKRHVRLTEPLEVEFIHLPPEETVQKQIDGLDLQKQNELAKHLKAMASLDEKISKLRAITYEPVSERQADV